MKRTYDEYVTGDQNRQPKTTKKKRTLKKTGDQEEGGSSLDKFESDFIDDEASASKSDDEFDPLAVNRNGVAPKLEKWTPDEEEESEYFSDSQDDNIKSGKPNQIRKLSKIADKQKKQQKVIQESDDESENETEVFDSLPICSESRSLDVDFRLREKDKNYYLPGDFCLGKQVYDRLFDHQKIGI